VLSRLGFFIVTHRHQLRPCGPVVRGVCVSARARACVYVCVGARACARVCARVPACVRACACGMRVCVYTSVREPPTHDY